MRFSYLRVSTVLVLAASSFATSPNIPKSLASAVSQSNAPMLAATQERVLEKGNRSNTETLVAANVSFGRGIYIRYNRDETRYIAYSG